MAVFRRFYDTSVSPENKSQWRKWIMDLNLMLDDLVRGINTPTLQVFADNTAALAGGLKAGEIYRTSSGVVMQVY